MKQLVIIGAGGMGRVIYDTARESVGYGKDFEIRGFIDDNVNALDCYDGYLPVLGTIKDYQVKCEDVFICSMGGDSRVNVTKIILNKGGKFINLIHETARIGTGVKMGEGNFVGPYSTIAANANIGNYNFLQQFVIIGHDCEMGDWNRCDSHSMFVGGTIVENQVSVHTSAVINHNVVLKNRSKVAACSFVIATVEEGSTVFGNPARRMK